MTFEVPKKGPRGRREIRGEKENASVACEREGRPEVSGLQCVVLQLRGRQVGQGDPGQPAAVDALRQAASAPGPRYTEAPAPHPPRRLHP